MHENQATSGRGSHSLPAPRSVDELARDDDWTVLRNAPGGRWSTAERNIERDGHHWQIGMTPVGTGTAALIMWFDGAVIAHRRGREAELCSTALVWISAVEDEAAAVR
ncbi:MAG TPA: hypothetical protein VGP26_31420 [Actinophytocola sp.]|nr:hypothetical protein [Actinophytocola sp.]